MDKENQQYQRNRLQEKAEKTSALVPFLILEWATGIGKTKAVLRCIANDKSDRKWLVVVPELIQIENMRTEITKHAYDHLLESKIYDIICYASFEKYKDLKLNLWLN